MNIKRRLEDALQGFNLNEWAKNDPLGCVMKWEEVKDIEIAGLFIAAISWGNRKAIIKTANRLNEQFENAGGPYEWLKKKVFENIDDNQCIYRTLKGEQFKESCRILADIYSNFPNLATFLSSHYPCYSTQSAVYHLADIICRPMNMGRSYRGSSMKRICMFMRWMCRDLGIWEMWWDKKSLYAIMDVHVLRQARKLGLLTIRTNNWKAVRELTKRFREMDKEDPLKYDFALFLLDKPKE